MAGLKRALRAENLGLTFHHGGVIDRLDCYIVTGFFLVIYISAIAYKADSHFASVKTMIRSLPIEAQKEIYYKLSADLLAAKVGT